MTGVIWEVKLQTKAGEATIYHGDYDSDIDAPVRSEKNFRSWNTYWHRFGRQVRLEITTFGDRPVATNCIYCGRLYFAEDKHCGLCHASPDADEYSFGFDPHTGWSRGLNDDEIEAITTARQRIKPEPLSPWSINPFDGTNGGYAQQSSRSYRAGKTAAAETLMQAALVKAKEAQYANPLSHDRKVAEPQDRTTASQHVVQNHMP